MTVGWNQELTEGHDLQWLGLVVDRLDHWALQRDLRFGTINFRLPLRANSAIDTTSQPFNNPTD